MSYSESRRRHRYNCSGNLGCNQNRWSDAPEYAKDKGITVHFIKEGFNTGNGNNMFKFMLTILGAVAEMERELTVERIREGMAKAKIYGTKTGRPVGRPPRQIPASFKKYYPMWKDGDIAATDFARLIGVSRPTIYKYIEEHEFTAKQ